MTDKPLSKLSSFPKGLVQPERGYRFSIDSLLLVSFVKLKKNQKVLDLGTGCGVLGIGLLLLYKKLPINVLGVELNRELIECARANIKMFGVEKKFFLVMADVRNFQPKRNFFDVVVINPPYRLVGEGRISPYKTKKDACFNFSASLEDFLKAAFYSLKNKADLYMVFLADKLVYVFKTLKKFRFEPKRIKFIHPRREKEASLFLIHAKKNASPNIIIEPPLILYHDMNNTPTDDLINFCPFVESLKNNT